jgi:hypothetical protein
MSDENPAPDQPDKPTDSPPEIQSAESIKLPITTQPDHTAEFQDVKTELSGYERSNRRWTIVIVVVNAITCLFIGLQWHEMNKQVMATQNQLTEMQRQTGIADRNAGSAEQANNISREALESVQRAFLTCGTIVQQRMLIHEKSGSHVVLHFTMPCENAGTTPANVTAQAFFNNTSPTEPTEKEFLRKPLIQAVDVGPKAFRNVGNITVPELEILGRELPEKLTDLLANPVPTVTATQFHFFWGWITYYDVFPKTSIHITEFCQELVGASIDRNNPQAPYVLAFAPCGHHICADEYCEDYEAVVALSTKK